MSIFKSKQENEEVNINKEDQENSSSSFRKTDDDFTIKTSRKTNIIIGIFSVLAAIAIWVYVVVSTALG
ncbi:MAG: hypothetical protein K6F14_08940 [Clostridiales bacterium]|nr:hypothetical protein [Clostridiales bacterium]